MKVSELISKLQGYDPDMEVVVYANPERHRDAYQEAEVGYEEGINSIIFF